MNRYSFYMVYCDPTTCSIPNLEWIESTSVDEAIHSFCQRHNFRFVESGPDYRGIMVWVEFPDRRMAQYLVSGHLT